MNPLVLNSVADLIKSVVGRLWPDPVQQAEAQFKLAQLVQNGELADLAANTQLALGQLNVNVEEAKSESLFKSGWRPFIGWTCGGGLFYQLLARPLLGWVAENMMHWTHPPSLEMDTLLTILFGMLGLGAYRTVEKVKGRA